MNALKRINPMTLLEKLGSYTLRNDVGNVLDENQKRAFLQFVKDFIPRKHKRIIYRGDSLDDMKAQFKYKNIDNNMLPYYIFAMGPKARACWDMTPKLIASNTTVENFKSILKKLRDGLKGYNHGGSYRTKRMNVFVASNEDFCKKIISDSASIEHNYQRLSKVEKEIINLFYLTLLHTLNSNGFGHRSTYLSATTSYLMAEHFAKDIIFFGWYPTTGNFWHNGGRIVNDCRGGEYKGIPLCKPAYAFQQEISLRCGLLPHFMLGYKMKANNVFYVNPAIESIANTNRSYEDIIENGFDIDQSNFEDFCKQTNFRYYFTVCNGHYELHRL